MSARDALFVLRSGALDTAHVRALADGSRVGVELTQAHAKHGLALACGRRSDGRDVFALGGGVTISSSSLVVSPAPLDLSISYRNLAGAYICFACLVFALALLDE